MKVVVGLGNPGSQYTGTRHNIGFDVVDLLASQWLAEKPQLKFQGQIQQVTTGGQKVLLVKPLTFMNRSGECVQPLLRFYQVPPEDLVVVCDDMNLPLGKLRWRAGGSSGGQKGLADILQRLGTEQVPRLRVGIGRPPDQMDPVNWVLARFRSDQQQQVQQSLASSADSIQVWVSKGLTEVMNRYNKSSDS
jgi:PTH1 family peptidyl-tRNA hydrolase